MADQGKALGVVFSNEIFDSPSAKNLTVGKPLPVTSGGTGNTTGAATINANLTGPITSVGNATSVASQTGTGSKFVMDTSPTLVTPNIGVASGVATVFNTNSATSGTTLSAANIVGGSSSVDLQMTGTLGGDANAQMPLATALIAAITNYAVGSSYRLRITNASSANHVWTVTTNTGWTLNGMMTIAQNTWREFVVVIASSTTATLTSVATGTYS